MALLTKPRWRWLPPPRVAADGFSVGLTFLLEKGESCVGRIADDFRQRWILGEVFPKKVWKGI